MNFCPDVEKKKTINCRRDVLSTKCPVDEMLFDKNAFSVVASTECLSTKVSVDKQHRIPLLYS